MFSRVLLLAGMANPSGERLADALNFIFDKDIDAAESLFPEKNEPDRSIRSVGRSRDTPNKEKKFDCVYKTCTSTSSVPPDEVVIEAMKLILDENVDATRIFALEKKEPTRLTHSSHGEDRESGRVKLKTKQKKYWSVLDDLLDNDSDDIFGPAFSKQNQSALLPKMKVSEGEIDQPQLAVEESLTTVCEFVPESKRISGEENGEHSVDISCHSSESKLMLKHESEAQGCEVEQLNDSTKNNKEFEDQEDGSDIKRNPCSVDQVTKDKSYLASDPADSYPFNSKVIFSDTEIKDLPASKTEKEISSPEFETLESNLPTSSPNKGRKNDISNTHEELDAICISRVSEEEEDVKPCTKRKETASTLESELTRNSYNGAEDFCFHTQPESDEVFLGCQRNVEEATKDQDRTEQSVHFRRTRPPNCKPCRPNFLSDDNGIEALLGSEKNKNIPSVEIKSDWDIVDWTTETTDSVTDINLIRISEPLLYTRSSENEESPSNADLLRNRELEGTVNLHKDLRSADTGVLLAQSLESCSESLQNAEADVECPLQQTSPKSGLDGISSFIFQLPPKFLSNALLLCAAGILLVAVPSLLLLLPVYILALFNALCLTGMLIVGAMVFMSCRAKEKKQTRNTNAHGTSMEHLQLREIKYFKSPDDVFKVC